MIDKYETAVIGKIGANILSLADVIREILQFLVTTVRNVSRLFSQRSILLMTLMQRPVWQETRYVKKKKKKKKVNR